MTVQNTIAFAADHAGVELKDHLPAWRVNIMMRMSYVFLHGL